MSCSVARRINLKKKMRDRKIRTRQEDVRMKQRLDRDLKVLWEEGITDQGLRASLEAGKGEEPDSPLEPWKEQKETSLSTPWF